MSRRVAVTAVGLVSPLGIGTEATWEAIRSGRSGIGGDRTEQSIGGAVASARGESDRACIAVGRRTARNTIIFACRRRQAWNTGCNHALSRDRAADVSTVACRTE